MNLFPPAPTPIVDKVAIPEARRTVPEHRHPTPPRAGVVMPPPVEEHTVDHAPPAAHGPVHVNPDDELAPPPSMAPPAPDAPVAAPADGSSTAAGREPITASGGSVTEPADVAAVVASGFGADAGN